MGSKSIAYARHVGALEVNSKYSQLAFPLAEPANSVLQPKYWCKHCTTYVKDTPFERKQHENTGKHQGNLRRFLQGIQKDHANNEREKDKVKAEVERLNRIAGTGTPSASASSAALPSPTPAFTKTNKPSSNTLSATDQKRQWAQLAEMGIAIPEHARSDMAMAGDWQRVSRNVQLEPEEQADDKLNLGIRKRKFEDDEDREEAGQTVAKRGWGLTTRTYPASMPADHDLDALLSLPLMKKEKVKDNSHADQQRPTLDPNIPNADPPVIKSEMSDIADRKLLGVQDTETQVVYPTSGPASDIKSETLDVDTKAEDHEVSVPVFRKRKAKLPPASKAGREAPG